MTRISARARNRLAGFAAGLALMLGAGAASAASWPTNVVGTYSGGANLTSIVVVIGYQQSAAGCPAISGTLQDLDANTIMPIQGYYCPGSGAIAFVRNDPTSGATLQAFYGSFAQAQAGSSNKVGGMFQDFTDLGALGQYSFTMSN